MQHAESLRSVTIWAVTKRVRTKEFELDAVQPALLYPLSQPILPLGHFARHAQDELLLKVQRLLRVLIQHPIISPQKAVRFVRLIQPLTLDRQLDVPALRSDRSSSLRLGLYS